MCRPYLDSNKPTEKRWENRGHLNADWTLANTKELLDFLGVIWYCGYGFLKQLLTEMFIKETDMISGSGYNVIQWGTGGGSTSVWSSHLGAGGARVPAPFPLPVWCLKFSVIKSQNEWQEKYAQASVSPLLAPSSTVKTESIKKNWATN